MKLETYDLSSDNSSLVFSFLSIGSKGIVFSKNFTTLNKNKNSITIDCNAVIKEIKIKYGEAPIFSNKYEKIKKSVYKLEN